jgi:hypothetical protein
MDGSPLDIAPMEVVELPLPVHLLVLLEERELLKRLLQLLLMICGHEELGRAVMVLQSAAVLCGRSAARAR